MYEVKSHRVTVQKIAACEMWIEHGRIVGPESGLILRLDDGTRHVWRSSAKNEAMPLVGDSYVSDPLLGLVYVVPADKFNELFVEV